MPYIRSMSARKVRNTSVLLVLLCALSVGSYGYLVGESVNWPREEVAEVQRAVSRVHDGGTLVARSVRLLRDLLVK